MTPPSSPVEVEATSPKVNGAETGPCLSPTNPLLDSKFEFAGDAEATSNAAGEARPPDLAGSRRWHAPATVAARAGGSEAPARSKLEVGNPYR
jgi:hypothetical protein